MKKIGIISWLVLAATGGCVPGQLFGAVKDACTVFAPADAEAVLGEPVGAPRSQDRSGGAGQGSECKFSSSQSKGLSRKSVSVSVQYPNAEADLSLSGIMESLKSGGFKNVREVPGTGDHAAWGTTSLLGKPMGQLTVLKGKHTMVVVIIMGLQVETTALDRAKALAAKVLPKT